MPTLAHRFLTVLVLVGLAIAALLMTQGESVKEQAGRECVPHVELLSARNWAEKLSRPESWVAANHRVDLWSVSDGEEKGAAVGKMRPGDRAPILDQTAGSFKVRSTFDGSTGWITSAQVARVVEIEPSTNEICDASR